MFPGMNMDPRQMRQAMKKLGIQQEEIEAKEVIIRLQDKEIVISNPSVTKVNMMGNDSFQISGEVSERSLDAVPDIGEDDINTVVEQTGAGKEEALKAIQDSNGDLAEAIMKLKKE